MSKLLTPMENAALPSPSRNGSHRRSENDILRANDFQIVSRPNVGPEIWKRRNEKMQWIEFTEREALDFCGYGNFAPRGQHANGRIWRQNGWLELARNCY